MEIYERVDDTRRWAIEVKTARPNEPTEDYGQLNHCKSYSHDARN